jgi:hypothetical protein
MMFKKQFKPPAHHGDWGGINYDMETGKVIRYENQAGVIIGDPLPTGKIPCWFGGEMQRHETSVNPFELVVTDLADLMPDECEAVLALMQALVFRLVEDKKPF